MSCSAWALTMIGYMIPGDRLIEENKYRCCNHPEKDTKFCPECGKPMWKTIKELPDVENLARELDAACSFTADVNSRDHYEGNMLVTTFYFGFEACESSHYDAAPMLSIPSLEEIEKCKSEVCSWLKAQGVFEDADFDKFGIWTLTIHG